MRACLVFGVQADGTEVGTVEGLADGERLSDLQQAFSDHHALLCGFCTPGFLMLAEAYLAEDAAQLTEARARELVAITFIEYRLPTAAEIPPVDVLLSQDAPSPGNPLGVMGAGEGGINAVGATVANAVRDALGLAGGVGQLPLTPARVCVLAALAQPTARPSHWRQGMTDRSPRLRQQDRPGGRAHPRAGHHRRAGPGGAVAPA